MERQRVEKYLDLGIERSAFMTAPGKYYKERFVVAK